MTEGDRNLKGGKDGIKDKNQTSEMDFIQAIAIGRPP